MCLHHKLFENLLWQQHKVLGSTRDKVVDFPKLVTFGLPIITRYYTVDH